MPRPELQKPPEIYYNDDEAVKYTSNSRIIEIQSERALDLLALPQDGVPRLLLDIGCGSWLSGEILSESGHQWIGVDISQSMLRVIDGAISISAVQWLCNAEKSSHSPRLRLKALYRCLSRGARAAFQLYPENLNQLELILSCAMCAGFAGGFLVDYPNSSNSKKEYLVLTCGPSSVLKEKGSCGDEENETVSNSDRNRPSKKQRITKNGEGRDWILKKKEQMRRKGDDVPPDTKYTGRKRKCLF